MKWNKTKNVIFLLLVCYLTLLTSCDVKKYNNEWVIKDKNWYYYDSSGKMVKENWIRDEGTGNWYYLKKDGSMAVSQWINNEYYVNEKGTMLFGGWHEIDSKRYYFADNGHVDFSRDYEQELREQLETLKKLEIEKNKNKTKAKVLSYQDVFGYHTLKFVLPKLPTKSSLGLTINDIDLKYLPKNAGVEINFICRGTKDKYIFPTITINAGKAGIFVAQDSTDSMMNTSFIATSGFQPIVVYEEDVTYQVNIE